jgi:hypothetical protein
MTAALLLAKLVALQGEWVATEDGKSSPAFFETAAKGTAVVQKSGYLAVFSLDGDALLANVFVDDGFSLRMRARGPKALTEKSIGFEVVDVANKAAAASGTTDRLELELVDANHIVERWRWRPPKGEPATITVSLERKPR